MIADDDASARLGPGARDATWRVANDKMKLSPSGAVWRNAENKCLVRHFETKESFGSVFLLNFQNAPFYPRDAMLARVIGTATCLSVCLSVCHALVLCQNEES